MALRAQKSMHNRISPDFILDYNYLQCIWALRRLDYTLPKPGIPDTSELQLEAELGLCGEAGKLVCP